MNLSPPRVRRVTVFAGLLGLLALGLAVRPVRADPPSDLAPLLATCRTFTNLSAEVTLRSGTKARDLPLLVTARSSWMMVDLLWGTHNRYGWKDNQLTMHNRSMTEAAPAADVSPIVVSDLWNACRTGFADTTWTVRRPDQDGFPHKYTALSWFKADLPYAWADTRDVYIGVNATSKVVNEVVWHAQGASDWSQLHVAAADWSATTPEFTRLAPSTELQRPARFRHVE